MYYISWTALDRCQGEGQLVNCKSTNSYAVIRGMNNIASSSSSSASSSSSSLFSGGSKKYNMGKTPAQESVLSPSPLSLVSIAIYDGGASGFSLPVVSDFRSPRCRLARLSQNVTGFLRNSGPGLICQRNIEIYV